jgi:biotin carboxylase
MTRLLLAGLSTDLLDVLGRILPSHSVVVLEEAGLFKKRELDRYREREPVDSVVLADYIQSDDYLAPLSAEHRNRPFDAVFPGTEYAVPAAADLAERFGLPGATLRAATCLRDKIRLREVAHAAGILGPAWTEATDETAAQRLAAQAPHGVVVKPADQAGSFGVRLLPPGADVVAHIAAVRAEPPDPMLCDRPLRRRYLVEERMVGREFSVELLVQGGAAIFTNVTAKHLWPGDRPVERGHDVPAPIVEPERQALVDASTRLVAATGFDTGILHAEWIVTDAGPALVECAARAPGDKIIDLLNLAYGFDVVTTLADLFRSRPVTVPARPVGGAAIRFLHALPGTVTGVDGLDKARSRPGVREAAVAVEPGASVNDLASSWDRIGYVLAAGRDVHAASEIADRAVGDIAVATQ